MEVEIVAAGKPNMTCKVPNWYSTLGGLWRRSDSDHFFRKSITGRTTGCGDDDENNS